MIDYKIRCSVERFVNDKIPTGGFLRSVLANDLMGAFNKADDFNREHMPEIVKYIYNELPVGCYGTYATVDSWLGGEAEED